MPWLNAIGLSVEALSWCATSSRRCVVSCVAFVSPVYTLVVRCIANLHSHHVFVFKHNDKVYVGEYGVN